VCFLFSNPGGFDMPAPPPSLRTLGFFPLLLLGACSQPGRGPTAEAAPAPTPSEAPVAISSASAPPPPASAVAAPSPKEPEGPRAWAKARFAWIYDSPTDRGAWIGYLALGGSVRLKTGKPVYPGALGCSWYEIEPKGFLCAAKKGSIPSPMGDTATIDPDDPVVRQLAYAGPDLSSPWPFEYGESIGAPRYEHLPTAGDLSRREGDLARHRAVIAKVGAQTDRGVRVTFPPLIPKARPTPEELLEGIDFAPGKDGAYAFLEMGQLVREARQQVSQGSTLGWSREIQHEGRPYLVTADHAIVPKDRIRPYPKSHFSGVHLGGDVQLPLAFFQSKPRPKYTRGADGFTKTDATFPRHGWVMLTGKEEKVGKKTWLETREKGVWIDAADATRPIPSQPPTLDLREGKGRRSWIEVSILSGWMIAYEADKPVFTTLISAGRGGVPYPGIDPRKTASTPVGLFRVDGKFRTATMVSSTELELVHGDVNWVMNFHGPHALHGAYWHDEWGQLRSAGCINLSPKDAKWVFEWTDPKIPADWYGIRAVEKLGQPTWVLVHP